mmetsp:Transcript_86075/g.263419  ORF Transcript_86075/g.263419 Transcript_86075/m.263419 type:complete len:239 (+) Transcript_86075:456-1172(+)
MTTTGINWSIKAIGPCFISAAGYPSAWTYAISLHFIAPSNAIGKLKPRPKYMKLLASTFWQLMSHKRQSPICKARSSSPSSPFSALDSLSRIVWICDGTACNSCRMRRRSKSDRLPHASPKATASSVKAAMVDERTLVEATPTSSPAITDKNVSLSRAMVDSSSLTTPMTRTSLPNSALRTTLRLSTDSPVSPELDTTMSTSPLRMTGVRNLYSDDNSTTTGMRAMCSMRYSATKAAW